MYYVWSLDWRVVEKRTLTASFWFKSVGLVQGSAAIWRCSAFIAWKGCTAPL